MHVILVSFHIYIQISWGFMQDCVFSFQVARIGWAMDLVWLHCKYNIFVKPLPLCIPLINFHCRSIQQWALPLLFLLSIKINLSVTCLFLLWSDLVLRIEYILLDLFYNIFSAYIYNFINITVHKDRSRCRKFPFCK